MWLAQFKQAVSVAMAPLPASGAREEVLARRRAAESFLTEFENRPSSIHSACAMLGLPIQSEEDAITAFLSAKMVEAWFKNGLATSTGNEAAATAAWHAVLAAVPAAVSAPAYLLGKLALVLSLATRALYPRAAPGIVQAVCDTASRMDWHGVLLLARYLRALHEEAVYSDSEGSALPGSTELKDALRASGTELRRIFEMLPTVLTAAAASDASGLAQDAATEYAQAVSCHIDWADVSLAIDPAVLRAVLAAVQSSSAPLAQSGIAILASLIDKGMDNAARMALYSSIGLVSLFAPSSSVCRAWLAADEDDAAPVFKALGSLLEVHTRYLLRGGDSTDVLSNPELAGATAVMIQATLQACQEWVALPRAPAAMLLPVASSWNLFVLFLARAVTGATASRKQTFGGDGASEGRPAGVQLLPHVASMLPLLVKSMRCRDDHDWDADADEPEFAAWEEARCALRNVFVGAARVVPDITLAALLTMAGAVPPVVGESSGDPGLFAMLTELPVADAELLLYLLYAFAEGAPDGLSSLIQARVRSNSEAAVAAQAAAVGASPTQVADLQCSPVPSAMNWLLITVHRACPWNHSHWAVCLAATELAARYIQIVLQEPDLLAPLLRQVLGRSGIRSAHDKLASRTAYLLLRVLKTLIRGRGRGKCLAPVAEELLASLQPFLLVSLPGRSGGKQPRAGASEGGIGLQRNEQAFLFEAASVIISAPWVPEDAQRSAVIGVLQPLVSAIATALQDPLVTALARGTPGHDDDDEDGVCSWLESCLSAAGHVTKGFGRPVPALAPVFSEVLDVTWAILNALPTSTRLRGRVIFLSHRMVTCLGSSICARLAAPNGLQLLLSHATGSGLEDILRLVNQAVLVGPDYSLARGWIAGGALSLLAQAVTPVLGADVTPGTHDAQIVHNIRRAWFATLEVVTAPAIAPGFAAPANAAALDAVLSTLMAPLSSPATSMEIFTHACRALRNVLAACAPAIGWADPGPAPGKAQSSIQVLSTAVPHEMLDAHVANTLRTWFMGTAPALAVAYVFGPKFAAKSPAAKSACTAAASVHGALILATGGDGSDGARAVNMLMGRFGTPADVAASYVTSCSEPNGNSAAGGALLHIAKLVRPPQHR